jgi:succinate dehydrogenase / fumarate reductase iron-sulfur subunit
MTTPTTAPTRTARFRVHRRKEGDAASHYDEFQVPVGADATVLDALFTIRREQDDSLTFRHSCFHASCGTCAMRVDGEEGLACVTEVGDRNEVTVEPLSNFPVVSDLVVDMLPIYESFEPTHRPLIRRSEAQPPELPDGIEAYTRYEDCIECGICLSACPIVGSDDRYVGPAALAAAWRVVEEPRGVRAGSVLGLMDDEQGAWRCHLAWECTEACPSNVDPAGKIMQLRRAAVRQRARRLFGMGGSDR